MNHNVIGRLSFDELVSVNEIMQCQIAALEYDKKQMIREDQLFKHRLKRRINDIRVALEDLAIVIQDDLLE